LLSPLSLHDALPILNGCFKRVDAACHQHHVNAFPDQRLRASETQSLAGAAHQRPFARDTQIHNNRPSYGSAITTTAMRASSAIRSEEHTSELQSRGH